MLRLLGSPRRRTDGVNNIFDHQQHDIGTVTGFEDYSRDRALDTPTLLSAKYTAPYFHDGSRPTLRSVNEWFNETYDLRLSDSDIDDLTAYSRDKDAGEGVSLALGSLWLPGHKPLNPYKFNHRRTSDASMVFALALS